MNDYVEPSQTYINWILNKQHLHIVSSQLYGGKTWWLAKNTKKLLLSAEIRILQFPGYSYVSENNIWFCLVLFWSVGCLIFPNSLWETCSRTFTLCWGSTRYQDARMCMETGGQIAVGGALCMQGRNPKESLQFTLF